MRLRVTVMTLCLAVATVCSFARQAAADQIAFIRDAEIETIIRGWWTPIILAAGLDPQAVHIYIVNDPTLNSFVAGGQNLFLNTGTLLKSQSPNQIVGIMAHETGHIAGGHLSRSEQAMHNATIASIIAMNEALMNDPEPDEFFETLTMPTLIMSGTADRNHKAAELLHEHIKGSEFRAIDGAGHAAMQEAPWAYDRHVIEFLDQHGLWPGVPPQWR